MDNKELKQAVLMMLQAELDAMHYYQQATRYISDNGASYHFNLLAQEELEHARAFYSVYPDTDLPEFEELVKTPPKVAPLETIDPQLFSELSEQAALELAMKMEEEVANRLKRILVEMTSPAARAVIEENIDSTLGHYELIKEDYQRLFEQPAEN